MQARDLPILIALFCSVWLVASAPTKPFGYHSTAGLGTSLANITSTFSLLPKGNSSNSAPAICSVGNTRTVLVIRLLDNRALKPLDLSLTIIAARSHVNRVVKYNGDGWLPTRDDPFRYNGNHGITIAAVSRPYQHLTWGILGSTLRGLQECLIANDWYNEALFQIFDGDWGHVGDGSLRSSKIDIGSLLEVGGLYSSS